MPHSTDRLTMLLSTDWFTPYWSTAGITVEPATRARLQQDCRTIVREFIGSAPTYWLTSFAADRIDESNRHFIAALQRQNLDHATMGRITDIVIWLSSEDPENRSVSLLADLTRQLIAHKAENPTGLSAITETVLGDAWETCEPKVPEIEGVCLRSATEWDRYILSLTPDLPTMLADYATSILRRNQLLCYWRIVEKTLLAAERSGLIGWYSAGAAALTG